MKILVSGATGKAGSEIAKALVKNKASVIVADRDVIKAATIFNGQCPVVRFDAYQVEPSSRVFEGLDKFFLLGTEGASSTESWKKIIDSAVSNGVRHIVFLSS